MSSRVSLWIGVRRSGRTVWMDEPRHGAWHQVGKALRHALEAKGFDVVTQWFNKIRVLDGASTLNDRAALAEADDAFVHFFTGEWASLRVPSHAAWRHKVKEPERAVLLDVDNRAIHLMRRGVEARADVPLPRVPDGVEVPDGMALVATLPAKSAAQELAAYEQWDTYDLHGYEKTAWEAAYQALASDVVRTVNVVDLVDEPAPSWMVPPSFKALVNEVRRELAISTAGYFVKSQDARRLVRWINVHAALRVDIAKGAELVPDVIEALLALDDEDVRTALAQRADTHGPLLVRVYKAGGARARDAVVAHPNAPGEVFVAVAEDADAERRHRVAHQTTHVEAQVMFAKHPDEQTRLWLAKNPQLTDAAHQILRRDPSLAVRAAAAR